MASLSHEDLAAKAGLTPAEAARHYPTVAACLRATYEEVADGLAADLRACFSNAVSWRTALGRASHALLARLAAHPAEARLCFLETLGGDRELRQLRDRRRRWVVNFLAEQSTPTERGERLSKVQIELLIGAMFHEISAAVAAGDDGMLRALEPRLSELSTVFDPSAFLGPPRPRLAVSGAGSLPRVAAHSG